ncbi:hypothetical protein GGI14_002066 [Coemansia sp. S680]|nr:hypothetical protein GGI14_002066 [Coemansia sp. S680]
MSPNGNGATSWFPVSWSKFSQGAQTNVITPAALTDITMSAHVQLTMTPVPPTLTGLTQTITPISSTLDTFMTATPALSTAFALTGIALTGIVLTGIALTGIAPTGIALTGIALTGFAQTIILPAALAASMQTTLAPTAFVLPAAPVPSGIAQTSFSSATAMPANPTQAAFGLSALAQAVAMSAALAPTGLAQTTITTLPHNLPTTFVGQMGPTQFTSMPAVPTSPAPTGFAQATILPASLTLLTPTSTGPAPPATTFTFASTLGSSHTQLQTNISAQCGSGSRGCQSGRLGNRSGKVSANQQVRLAEPPVNTYVYHYGLE